MLRDLVRYVSRNMAGELIEGLLPEKVVRTRNAVGRVLMGIGLFLSLVGFFGFIRLEEEGLGTFFSAVGFIGFIFIMVGMRLRWFRFIE